MAAYYVDSSALVKLIVLENETSALQSWIGESDADLISCDLARTEVLRATRRVGGDVVLAKAVLDSVELVALDRSMFDAAGRVDPEILRTLDAVHLVAALALGDDLAGMVTYDDRMAYAAITHGIATLAPS
ncbi:type II toxin-antitoxin system VapC family toxin [Agromyces aerolatus]|uniref:type II toxin-antitoxin system VapC family toxin n=1 Tax=Agromyces sp. LY-1074 TaxID=3074080 RepID=UPI002860AF6B|nr:MULTISPECIES: type II toxin-antitoxin system VapC family toxin [unclassified Agromyces]MDR5699295.1 type II toxin-antitoxin system VapC family toxin [Agromyces sp. LY-1074]MDR5705591.1 type II toxin-antitoxin system VapC family toxin [Agromyces sp. LY-1358]